MKLPLLLPALPALALAAPPPGFTPIFNGKDLAGWHVHRINHHGTSRSWTVEDGVILATQDRPGNGGILLTDRRYRDFEVFLEIKPNFDYLEGGVAGGIYGEGLQGVDKGAGERNNRDWARHAADGATEGMIALQMHYSNAQTPRWAPGGLHRFRNLAVKELVPPGGERRELRLSEFEPRSMLKVPAHEVGRAVFPAIDVHNHVNDARGGAPPVPVPELLARMDRVNLKRIVILTGRWGEALQHVIDRMVKPHPDRFTVFAEPDWSRVDDPDFGEAMAAQVRDAVARGARGLKITKALGLGVRYREGPLVAVDDPRLDPMWAECGRLRVPVAIHTSDPDAFFEPVDGRNERWDELLEHPDWSFHGERFPPKRALLDARDRVFARHPGTTFIALHVANHPEDLDYVAAVLDRHPNVVVETGARHAELGRQPRRAREFFLRYQDRILFGTDFAPEEGMYRNWFRFLETADEHFDYWNHPGQGRWRISGLDLPRDVLEKVYARNAERVIPASAPTGERR
jgi:predicted TIM-barrel fold metal-dependent hydrolase